ncbi:putative zinc finger in N-recognin-domain-containing protein [Baffinella frigidus]|nr:putative zinc finger in N-recognin-domain-containing protein [Cryptophyta sp. CCMP2293]
MLSQVGGCDLSDLFRSFLLQSPEAEIVERPRMFSGDVQEFLRFCRNELDPPAVAEPDCPIARHLHQLARSPFLSGCTALLAQIQRDILAGANYKAPAPCGGRIPAGETAYKCLDCGVDPTCVMCVECFMHSPCVNHNFRLVKSGGGCCDCGDQEAWNPSSFCTRHANCAGFKQMCTAAALMDKSNTCVGPKLFDTIFDMLALSLEPGRDDPRADFWGGGAPLSPQECVDVLKMCNTAAAMERPRQVMAILLTRPGVEVHKCHVGARGRNIAPLHRSGTHLERFLWLYADAPPAVQEQLDELFHAQLDEIFRA